jgi:hypothetical protein
MTPAIRQAAFNFKWLCQVCDWTSGVVNSYAHGRTPCVWRVCLLVCSVVWLTVGYQGLHLADKWVPDARMHMQ